jgi:hypothetical protein
MKQSQPWGTLILTFSQREKGHLNGTKKQSRTYSRKEKILVSEDIVFINSNNPSVPRRSSFEQRRAASYAY